MSLIAAIGAQNTFVLRQGLQRRYVFAVCLTYTASDALLISAGIAGFGLLVTAMPWFDKAMTAGGCAFLSAYAAKSFLAAFSHSSSLEPSGSGMNSRFQAIVAALAFTWLNPHVYLNTAALLGSISNSDGDNSFVFAAGAVAASFVFFSRWDLGLDC